MGHMPVGLGNVHREMTVITAANGLLEGHAFFRYSGVKGVQMTIFAVRL
jgi:hypothetical protein